MATVSVLCTRVRVEEKQIIAALATTGVPALPLDPTRAPLPVGSVPPGPSAELSDGDAARVILDRCQDRAVAAAVLPTMRARGAVILDAGYAATRDRLAVAATLAAAGVPRPDTRLVCSEESALVALEEIGYPTTLLPLAPSGSEIVLFDHDIAEAILEHRAVLGAKQDIVALAQAGLPAPAQRLTVIVVDGRAVGILGALDSAAKQARCARIAEMAATVLGAAIVGIEVALTPSGPVVWDIQATPDFRGATHLGDETVAEAIAQVAGRALGHVATCSSVHVEIEAAHRREVTGDVALSA